MSCVTPGALSGMSIRAAATTPFEQTKIDRQIYVLRKALEKDTFERQWHFVDAENLVPVMQNMISGNVMGRSARTSVASNN